MKDGYANMCKECASPKNNIERHIHIYKNNARRRNIQFNLKEEDFIKIISDNCYYCGSPQANGIDRVDSNKDYILENCVPCCEFCNKMKLDHSIEE